MSPTLNFYYTLSAQISHHEFRRRHPVLVFGEDVDLVVDVELVVLHEAHGVRVLPLHPPHVLTQLRAALPHSPGQVLADVDGGALDQVPLPQHLCNIGVKIP